MALLDGFLNLNKPAGWTSHDCVAKVRRLLKMKRVGHGGTLDPLAVGVLPIALGRATRLLQYLPQDKAYRARIRFGMSTATDDLEGDILTSAPCPELTQDDVTALLPCFLGKIQQIPPKYSAIQVGGKRLYELARAGVEVDVPVRTVEIYDLTVLAWHPGQLPELEVAIACSSGTYIRAIARDLGDMAGVGATLSHLERTQSCGLFLDNSVTIEQLETQVTHQTFSPIPPHQALNHLGQVTFPPDLAARWLNGQAITIHNDAKSDGVERQDIGIDQELQGKLLEFPKNSAHHHFATTMPTFVRVYDDTPMFLGLGRCVVEERDRLPGHYTIVPKVVFH